MYLYLLYYLLYNFRYQCFKDTKGVFTKNWTIVINHTLQSMIAGENDIYGWSNEVISFTIFVVIRYRKSWLTIFFFQGILLELTQRKEHKLKVYGINVKYFTFINPTDDTVATINENNILQVWDVSTGEFVNILITIIVY